MSPHGVLLCALLLLLSLLTPSLAVKCIDCVGRNCMGDFCHGDYCVLSHYAPRWGTSEWGEPRVVKGCMSGKMLRKDVRSHCETVDEDGEQVFTCYCNNKNYCNGDEAVHRLEVQPVPLLTCVCEGVHCKGSSTCLGELCSYVVNQNSKAVEQGCVNASVPLVERRSAGACMMPPITGAMHHTVAKTAEDLLLTESCLCGTDYCNAEKPEVSVPEKMTCSAFVRAELHGTKMESRNLSCNGEYCFKASIKSKIGHMTSFSTMGCASFIDEAQLAEELNPTGCAKFESENVEVEACLQTTDKRAIARARANQEITESRRRGKSKARTPKKPKFEVSYDDDDDEAETEAEEEAGAVETKERSSIKQQPKQKGRQTKEGEAETAPSDADADGDGDGEGEDEAAPSDEEAGGEGAGAEATEESTVHYIFERPTQAPVPEDSNVALISVFLLLIVLIALSGVVWKLELHKKLFRSSYDTVAGG